MQPRTGLPRAYSAASRRGGDAPAGRGSDPPGMEENGRVIAAVVPPLDQRYPVIP